MSNIGPFYFQSIMILLLIGTDFEGFHILTGMKMVHCVISERGLTNGCGHSSIYCIQQSISGKMVAPIVGQLFDNAGPKKNDLSLLPQSDLTVQYSANSIKHTKIC